MKVMVIKITITIIIITKITITKITIINVIITKVTVLVVCCLLSAQRLLVFLYRAFPSNILTTSYLRYFPVVCRYRLRYRNIFSLHNPDKL